MGSICRLCKKVGLQAALKGIDGGRESYVKRQVIPDCRGMTAKELLPNSVENRGQARSCLFWSIFWNNFVSNKLRWSVKTSENVVARRTTCYCKIMRRLFFLNCKWRTNALTAFSYELVHLRPTIAKQFCLIWRLCRFCIATLSVADAGHKGLVSCPGNGVSLFYTQHQQ